MIKNVVELIGNTPVISVMKGLYAKLEYANPSGSVKDRAAYFMIKKALERGEIGDGATIVEPTSGNTGIGIAMIARAMGLKAVLVMPENMSRERISLITAYGATVVLTPAALGMQGATQKAKEIVLSEKNSFMPNQFENPDNALAHFTTTAPEIFSILPSVKYIVCGVGSGGTAMGIKRYILDKKLNCKMVGVEPASSPLISGGVASKHKIQGIGANFLPKLLDKSLLDRILTIKDEEAFSGARELAKEFGVLSGISAGAAFQGAKKIVAELKERGERADVLFIVPDGGSRYLSMGLYD